MVTAEKVFSELRSPLIARLGGDSDLLFTGRPDFLDYLAAFFGSASLHAYVQLDAAPEVWEQLLTGRNTVVVASDDEDSVAAGLESMLAGLGLRPRIVRLFGDLFVNVMCGGNPWKWGPQEVTAPKESYAILSTPRTGTEFLCEALASTNAAGFPKEHLRSQSEALTRFCHFDADRYLQILMSRLMTSNRIFGTKLISHFLVEHIRLCPTLDHRLAQFKYVRVSRRDVVGQAISAMLAAKTGTYHVRDDVQLERYRERLVDSEIGPADLRNVENIRKNFAAQRRQIDEFVQRHSITPLDLVFEDVIEEPVKSVNDVLSFLGDPTRVDKISVTVRKTGDTATEAVRLKYLEGSYGS